MAIQSFVFFDLETTGLPHEENNRTKITELAFVAVLRGDIENAAVSTLPLTNKLSLLFNPERPIQPKATEITGLTKECLEKQPLFKDKIQCINTFLDLPKPVCLVAHNGDTFDFKILITEYNDARVALPSGLKCVDSLKAFKEIIINQTMREDIGESSSQEHEDDSIWPSLDITPEEWQGIDALDSFSELSVTPDKRVKKETKISKPKGYSLPNLYEHLIKEKPIGSHRAEADCIMLLKCAIALKREFLQWADNNCKNINEVQPLFRQQIFYNNNLLCIHL